MKPRIGSPTLCVISKIDKEWGVVPVSPQSWIHRSPPGPPAPKRNLREKLVTPQGRACA